MENTHQTPPAATTYRRVRLIALGLSVLIWGAYVLLRMDDLPAQEGFVYAATPLTAIPFALILGYGLATIFGLLLANRHRLRGVLRLTRGHIIGALALALVTPMVIYDWLPWIVLGLLAFVIPFGILPAVILTLLWYPVACLIVSGTKSKLLRFGLFCLMFWATYSAQMLLFGVRHFSL